MSLLKTPKAYKKTTWGKRVPSGERTFSERQMARQIINPTRYFTLLMLVLVVINAICLVTTGKVSDGFTAGVFVFVVGSALATTIDYRFKRLEARL